MVRYTIIFLYADAFLPSPQIDCSHGNSSKQHRKQVDVAEDIVRMHCLGVLVLCNSNILQAQQLESADTSSYIMGVMVESNLVEGRQDIPASGPAGLKYGQSVTDACLSWEMTVPLLNRLREGVQGRRRLITRQAKGLDADGVKINGSNGQNGHY
jgi:3-deoxy-7-phosphoheptulonate synthase